MSITMAITMSKTALKGRSIDHYGLDRHYIDIFHLIGRGTYTYNDVTLERKFTSTF